MGDSLSWVLQVNISVAIIPMAQDFGWSPTVAGEAGNERRTPLNAPPPAHVCLLPAAGTWHPALPCASSGARRMGWERPAVHP